MTIKSIKCIMTATLVTIIGFSAIADQKTQSHSETTVSKKAWPIEIKYLPMILDNKKINFEKLKNVRAEDFNLDLTYGPGSSGGGNLCAYDITAASSFIAKNVDLIPFSNNNQRSQFLKKMSEAVFLAGDNLSVRGQKVNALNFPSYGVIVLDGAACDLLEQKSASAYSLLLHEYLGLAGLDDRSYQLSSLFEKEILKDGPIEETCSTDGCVMRKTAQRAAIFDWIRHNDDCENMVGWLQSFRKISENKFELICGDTSDRTIIILKTIPVPGTYDEKFTVQIQRSKHL